MDAFRILSRSTNASRKPAKLSIAPGLQSTPQAPAVQSRHIETTKKRKREIEDTDSPLPSQLDFFGGTQTAGQHDPVEVITHTTPTKDSDIKATEAQDSLLPEDECRRILRLHKLKITRLNSVTEELDHASSKKKHRPKNAEAAESKKSKKHKSDVVPQPLTDFEQLRTRYHIDEQLATNLKERRYETPTEVQIAAWPLLLGGASGNARQARDSGKRKRAGSEHNGIGVDLLSVAPTGSGKTLAYLVPVLNALAKERQANEGLQRTADAPKAIIVAPTKELAVQIVYETRSLVKNMPLTVSIAKKTMPLGGHVHDAQNQDDSDDEENSEDDIAGGRSKRGQTSIPDVLISTPLTLVNAMTSTDGTKNMIPSVRYLVLDEADVLLDPVFRTQTLQIWNNCSHPDLRVSLWSATMGASIESLAQSTITSRLSSLPPANGPTTQLLRLVVGLKDSAIPHIHHRLTYCGTEAGKLLALRQLLRPSNPASATNPNEPSLRPPFLVFTQTIPRAKALHAELLYDIPPSAGGPSRIAVLHADLPSATRASIMSRVRRGEVWVLITTDLLSRGVDFKGINGVVNYDFPGSSAAYVHRVGRTGRAGRAGGVAVTLYAKEDVPFVKNVANVVAASQRARGAEGEEGGLAPWLLNALPKPSKRDRQRLKKRGIEERRADGGKAGAKVVSKMSISTKSGFEKQVEGRRRGAVEGTKRRAKVAQEEGGDEDDFEGFD